MVTQILGHLCFPLKAWTLGARLFKVTELTIVTAVRRTVEGPLSRSCWYRGHNEAGGRRKTAYECGVAAAAFRSSKNALAPPIARPGHPTPPCCRRSVSSRFTYGTGKPIGSLGADVFLADPSWGSRARRQRSSWRRSRSRWAGRGMSRWIATCWPPRLAYQHPGPRLRVKVPEVLHGQGDVPAAVGILTSSRPPGSGSVSAQLGCSGDIQRDHHRGLGQCDPASAEAERNNDGGGADRGGGNDNGQVAPVTPPRRQAG
jgi:hypothetical protein